MPLRTIMAEAIKLIPSGIIITALIFGGKEIITNDRRNTDEHTEIRADNHVTKEIVTRIDARQEMMIENVKEQKDTLRRIEQKL